MAYFEVDLEALSHLVNVLANIGPEIEDMLAQYNRAYGQFFPDFVAPRRAVYEDLAQQYFTNLYAANQHRASVHDYLQRFVEAVRNAQG
jgi:hypothetical protein